MTVINTTTPLGDLRETLAAALENEEQRFAILVAEHDDAVARIMQMLDLLDAPTAPNGAAVIAHTNGSAATAHTNGAAPPSVPVVEPEDVEVDLSGMKMEDAVLTVMQTRPGQVWRAKDLSPILSAAGISGQVSSIAACLSIAFRNGKLRKADPGEYIHR